VTDGSLDLNGETSDVRSDRYVSLTRLRFFDSVNDGRWSDGVDGPGCIINAIGNHRIDATERFHR
jgi:hypothetical protein